ncbi:MAG: DUF3072 domain-containing protein [Ginsengibacter sp.]
MNSVNDSKRDKRNLKNEGNDLTGSNRVKDPEDWTTGDEPMTGAQRSYLHTLAEGTGEKIDDKMTKAQAAEKIEAFHKADREKQVASKGNDNEGNAIKDPDNWKTGDEPMTGAQKSYLKTLSDQAGEEMNENLTKAQASKRIDELQQKTGRGR